MTDVFAAIVSEPRVDNRAAEPRCLRISVLDGFRLEEEGVRVLLPEGIRPPLGKAPPMKVIVGGSRLIGSKLVEKLRSVDVRPRHDVRVATIPFSRDTE